MKASIIGWELPPAFSGGLGVHTANLFSLIGRMMRLELYVPDLGYQFPPYPFIIKKIKLQRGISGDPYSRISDFEQAVKDYNERAVAAFDPRGVKLVHCHDWITMQAGITIKRKYGLPLVITFHSTEYDRSGNFNPQQHIIDIEMEGAREADAIITVSNFTKETVSTRYSIDPAKISTIYNGVTHFPITGLRRGERFRRVIFLGRITTQKGPKFFVEAAAKAMDYINDITFSMIGSGDLQAEMRELVSSYGLGHRINFTGFAHFQDVLRYYSTSMLFVLPAVSEPFGMTVLEAMSLGLPAIVSYTTGVNEALNNILRVDFWDTDLLASYIVAVMKHPGLWTELSRNGAMEAMNFTWEAAARRTMEVYSRL